MSLETIELYLCHECDFLHEIPPLNPGYTARCAQCNAFIASRKSLDESATIALTLAAVVFYLVANTFPLITLDLAGNTQAGLLITGVIQLWDSGMWPLAGLVFFTTILLPGLYLAGLLYVLIPLHFARRAPNAGSVFRYVLHLETWNMLEIYLLGVLVALTKLGSIASLILGPALYAFVALILVNAASASQLDKHGVWKKISSLQ